MCSIDLPWRCGEFFDEVFHQQWNIGFPLAQGGNPDGEDVQSIIQIRAKFLLLHHLPQILIGGGDDAHVNRNGTPASQPFDLLFLEYAKKFGLQFERKISDFIQK